jgi:hypothetical protein
MSKIYNINATIELDREARDFKTGALRISASSVRSVFDLGMLAQDLINRDMEVTIGSPREESVLAPSVTINIPMMEVKTKAREVLE